MEMLFKSALQGVKDELENTLHFRRERVELYPYDKRNEEAVVLISRMLPLIDTVGRDAKARLEITADCWRRLQEAIVALPDPYLETDPVQESLSAYMRSFGFRSFPASVDEFIDEVSDAIDSGLPDLEKAYRKLKAIEKESA